MIEKSSLDPRRRRARAERVVAEGPVGRRILKIPVPAARSRDLGIRGWPQAPSSVRVSVSQWYSAQVRRAHGSLYHVCVRYGVGVFTVYDHVHSAPAETNRDYI